MDPYAAIIGIGAGAALGYAPYVLTRRWLQRKPQPEKARQTPVESGAHDAAPIPPKPKPKPESDPVKTARIYKSNKDEICVWGALPRDVDTTWLGQSDKKRTGLYGVTPYAVSRIVTALERERVNVEISPPVVMDTKRAESIRKRTRRVHHEQPKPKHDLENGHTLMDYQRVTLAFADATGGRFILGDEPGLGKTVQAIAVSQHLAAERVLILTKASIKYQWADELQQFANVTPYVMEGMTAQRVPEHVQYVVGNYDILEKWLPEIMDWNPDMVVADECHWMSNPNANRSMASKTIATHADFFMGLSGTPIRGRPKDLWNLLDTAQPGLWGSKYAYELAYCNGRRVPMRRRGKGGRSFTNIVWKADGSSHEDVLNDHLSAVLLRRLKSEVMLELPERTRSKVPILLSRKSQAEYDAVEAAYMEAVKKKDHQKALNLREEMRQVSSLGRVDATVERALSIVKEDEKQVIIFAYFLESMDRIQEALESKGLRIGRVDGNVAPKARKQIQDAFQAGNLDVFLGQVQASGEGINLYRADTTLHHDLTWSPFEQEQAESRVHRRGQKNATTHLYFLGKGTLDEKVVALTLKKLQMSRSILDTGEKVDREVMRQVEKEYFTRRG